MKADMNAPDGLGKQRTAFPGVVADTDDQINGFIHDGIDRFGVQPFGRQAQLPQCLDRSLCNV